MLRFKTKEFLSADEFIDIWVLLWQMVVAGVKDTGRKREKMTEIYNKFWTFLFLSHGEPSQRQLRIAKYHMR